MLGAGKGAVHYEAEALSRLYLMQKVETDLFLGAYNCRHVATGIAVCASL